MNGPCVRVMPSLLPATEDVHQWISVGMCMTPLMFTILIKDLEVKLIVRRYFLLMI